MTDLLPFFQLVAAFAALFLFGGLVLGIVRRPSAATVSVLVRGALIPAAAFAWYALFPGDLNPETPITWIGVSLLVAGLLLGIYNRRLVVRMRGSVADSRLLTHQVQLGVVSTYSITLGISCVMWMFEPAFAVANAALSLVWAAAWIPERFRRASGVVSVDVDADATRAWDFIVDPANRVATSTTFWTTRPSLLGRSALEAGSPQRC